MGWGRNNVKSFSGETAEKKDLSGECPGGKEKG